MTVEHSERHPRAAAISRRRLLSGFVAAASAAALAPVLDEPRPISAQTPVATPGATIPHTRYETPDTTVELRVEDGALVLIYESTNCIRCRSKFRQPWLRTFRRESRSSSLPRI